MRLRLEAPPPRARKKKREKGKGEENLARLSFSVRGRDGGDRGGRRRRRRRGEAGGGGEGGAGERRGGGPRGGRVLRRGVRGPGAAARVRGAGRRRRGIARRARRQRLPRAPVGRAQQLPPRRALHHRARRRCKCGGQRTADGAALGGGAWSHCCGGCAAGEWREGRGGRCEWLPVHVAAQYGQTAFLHHIISKYGADFESLDNDGRSPLHWAAYKGNADTIRLLLFMDANQVRQDKNGCTPLHWAAIRGNYEVCTVLVHAGTKEELTLKDSSGFTPVELANDKGHRHLSYILSNATKVTFEDKYCSGRSRKIGYAPILFCFLVVLITLFLNSIIFAPNFSRITAAVGLWSWGAISLAFASLVMFYRVSRKNPGYIQANTKRLDPKEPLMEIDLNSSAWTGNWSQLCPTCKIIRPVRSKHCPTCKHCVEQFDHHCPWISNCVGKKNKWDFFVFLCMGTTTAFLGAAIGFHRLWTEPIILSSSESWINFMLSNHPGAVLFMFMDVFLLTGALILTGAQATQIARNLTTNEAANQSRYAYLRGPDGRFRNPYSRGCQRNCADFLVNGYSNDEEAAWPTLQQTVQRS